MAKWRKKQIRNNKIKKPQNESMGKHKLTRKTTIIFRFCLFENVCYKEYNMLFSRYFVLYKRMYNTVFIS